MSPTPTNPSTPPDRPRAADDPVTIWTIGHSTRTSEEFVSLLVENGIEVLVDVRRFPGSRRLPQFASDTLAAALAARDIGYCWIEALGGRRRTDPSSTASSAWRLPAFRAYADHARTEPFAEGLFELTNLAFGAPTAIMCAEVLWWRCHRRIISDVLTSLDIRVEHILGPGKVETHRIAPPARIVRGALSYAAPRTPPTEGSPHAG